MKPEDREVAESAFDKNKRREAEINNALRHEDARHAAAVKNMHRLRDLRSSATPKMPLQRTST
jgi:hypothetical protein